MNAPRQPIVKAAISLLIVFLMAGTALAIDPRRKTPSSSARGSSGIW